MNHMGIIYLLWEKGVFFQTDGFGVRIPANVYLNRRPRREILANLLKLTGCEFQVVRLSTVYCNEF